MNFIEKIKYRINYYQDGMNKTNGVDNISQEKINELQWCLSELEKEADRKKCCNCIHRGYCLMEYEVIFSDRVDSDNLIKLNYCSNFLNKNEK
jgi:hypothetical protein